MIGLHVLHQCHRKQHGDGNYNHCFYSHDIFNLTFNAISLFVADPSEFFLMIWFAKPEKFDPGNEFQEATAFAIASPGKMEVGVQQGCSLLHKLHVLLLYNNGALPAGEFLLYFLSSKLRVTHDFFY